jgi:hypothetical protein
VIFVIVAAAATVGVVIPPHGGVEIDAFIK